MPSGDPAIHRQRDKWVLRQSGYDAATGRRRVRQLGTFPTQRAARAAQRDALRSPAAAATLAEYLELVWLPAKAGRVEPSTADQYTWADHELHVTQQLAVEGGRPRIKDLKTSTSERIVTFGPGTARVLGAHAPRRSRPGSPSYHPARGAACRPR